ncbi:MAG: carbohydrate kinase [Saprospiraceae bacterium]|nr:carbohydrate kinase [Saprospiraceae bacterium]MBK8283258.1 carbohydrate kinase [Saprospiraceae bacterium]MBK9678392.1 carbohydrate kinase [Saprospiraceae bacterium]
MYFLGIDLGSSFIKASLIEADTQKRVGSASVPDQEMGMIARHSGWAEQEPTQWWLEIKTLIKKLIHQTGIDGSSIAAIGISYQMHGLVLLDKAGQTLRPSIIWCDSRAVSIGDKAFESIGSTFCLSHLLNSPGNFTASKLRWVIENEPDIAARIHAFMLPGDFINFKLTGEINTTISSLSEGMFWDFKNESLSKELFDLYHIPLSWTPTIRPTFSVQGTVMTEVAKELGLKPGTPVTYRAGDQPNNAFSLNVMKPGEIATTAGTSGVVYGIQEHLSTDPASRVNAFAHVNHSSEQPSIGVLLCVNGTGIANSWIKKLLNHNGDMSYEKLNDLASMAPMGSAGLTMFPFGNGAERMLKNKMVGAQLLNLDFNRHSLSHVSRAVQEGIVFALHYGTDILKENGLQPKTIKAGKANMFLSPVFRQMFSDLINVPLEFYDTDGATGAARGAGIGSGYYTVDNAFSSLQKIEEILPDPINHIQLKELYEPWKQKLNTLEAL